MCLLTRRARDASFDSRGLISKREIKVKARRSARALRFRASKNGVAGHNAWEIFRSRGICVSRLRGRRAGARARAHIHAEHRLFTELLVFARVRNRFFRIIHRDEGILPPNWLDAKLVSLSDVSEIFVSFGRINLRGSIDFNRLAKSSREIRRLSTLAPFACSKREGEPHRDSFVRPVTQVTRDGIRFRVARTFNLERSRDGISTIGSNLRRRRKVSGRIDGSK